MIWPQRTLCQSPRVRPISLYDLLGVFYTFAACLTIAAVVCFLENFHSVYTVMTGSCQQCKKTFNSFSTGVIASFSHRMPGDGH